MQADANLSFEFLIFDVAITLNFRLPTLYFLPYLSLTTEKIATSGTLLHEQITSPYIAVVKTPEHFKIRRRMPFAQIMGGNERAAMDIG